MGLKKMAHSEWDKHSVLRRQMRAAQKARLREDSKMCQDGEFCFFGAPIGEELPQKKQPASQDFYEVKEKIAVLSDNGRTKKEIRRVRWGEHPVIGMRFFVRHSEPLPPRRDPEACLCCSADMRYMAQNHLLPVSNYNILL